MNKENTINEKEAREAVYKALKEKGVDVTKSLVDKIMDTQIDLAINGVKKGYGIKMQGLGTLKIVDLKARSYKLPDGTVVNKDARKTVHFEISDKLQEELNKLL